MASPDIDPFLDAAASTEDPVVAGQALSSLCAAILEPPLEDLIDERSFDVFDAAARHMSRSPECTALSEKLLAGVATHASAREAFCMLMEALGTKVQPAAQLLLLRMVSQVLPRLKRKRAEFMETCLSSLRARYLEDAWPGTAWDDDDEAESSSASGGVPPSEQLVSVLLDCTEPLTCEFGAASSSSALAADEAAKRGRRILLGFLWRVLELLAKTRMSETLFERALLAIDACVPSLVEIEGATFSPLAQGGAAPPGADGAAAAMSDAHGDAAHGETVVSAAASASGDEPASGCLLKWPLIGVAAYAHAVLDRTHPGSNTPLGTALVECDPPRRIRVVSALGRCLLSQPGHHLSERGHALLQTAVVSTATPRGCLGDEHAAAQAELAAAARALVAHMSRHPVQAERTAAYETLMALLWLWSAPPRLGALTALLHDCTFPKAAALLVHRLKDEFLREAKEVAREPSAGGGAPADAAAVAGASPPSLPPRRDGVFTAHALMSAIDPLLAVPTRTDADPLDSLDAWSAALNLVRLLLARSRAPAAAVAGLPPDCIAQLKRERLAPLDEWVRRHMDELWAEIQAAEAAPPEAAPLALGGRALDEMRVSFTHLHVASDVSRVTLELASDLS